MLVSQVLGLCATGQLPVISAFKLVQDTELPRSINVTTQAEKPRAGMTIEPSKRERNACNIGIPCLRRVEI